MKREKKCQNCVHFPCYKVVCNIGNKEGCDNFKSIIQEAIEVIDKCNEEGKNGNI